MKIVVIDGQGGRLGRLVIEKLIELGCGEPLVAVGTNALATAAMLKAGVKRGATGENAVCVQAREADVIVGPVGMVVADALLGEITPRMAAAVAQSGAVKLLLPTNRCKVDVIGVRTCTMEELAREAAERVAQIVRDGANRA